MYLFVSIDKAWQNIKRTFWRTLGTFFFLIAKPIIHDYNLYNKCRFIPESEYLVNLYVDRILGYIIPQNNYVCALILQMKTNISSEKHYIKIENYSF